MLEFLNGLPTPLIYASLFILLLLCGLGFPMAEEFVLLAGGVWWRSGHLHPVLMLLVNFLGVLIGDVFLFGLGRGVSNRISRSPRFTHWFAQKLERGRPFFARYGTPGLSRSFYPWLAGSDVSDRRDYADVAMAFCRH